MGPRDTELRGGSSSCRHLRELDPLGTQSCPASQKQRHGQCTHDGCYLMLSTGRHREVAAYTVIVPDRLACGAAQGHPGLTSLVPGWGPRTQRRGPPSASLHVVLVPFPKHLPHSVYSPSLCWLLGGESSNTKFFFCLVPLSSPHPSQVLPEGRSPKQHVEKTRWQRGHRAALRGRPP